MLKVRFLVAGGKADEELCEPKGLYVFIGKRYNTLMQEGVDHSDHNQPAGWQFQSEKPSPSQAPISSVRPPLPPASGYVSWTASEFIAHQKSAGWYARLGLVAGAICILVYLLTNDVISAGMIIVVALALAVFAARQPRTLSYRVDSNGVTIGQKTYPYMNFRSFAVIDEEAVSSLMFIPLKRFMPSITVYYEDKDEEAILGLLSNYLPFEHQTHDVVDRFMKRIRF